MKAHGITLSETQLAWARERIASLGLQDRVTVVLQDYRDLRGDGTYDHGIDHGITHDVEGWEKTLSSEFINRYVLPDVQIDTIGNIQRGMEHAGFESYDVESLRPHYALTLRHWGTQLENHHLQRQHLYPVPDCTQAALKAAW